MSAPRRDSARHGERVTNPPTPRGSAIAFAGEGLLTIVDGFVRVVVEGVTTGVVARVSAASSRRLRARKAPAASPTPPPTLPAPPHGPTVDQALADVVARLEPDARRVLLYVGHRLLSGQLAYGMLDVVADARDWRREASEEVADMLVYLACEALRREVIQIPEGTL